jgi:hypothetical protein
MKWKNLNFIGENSLCEEPHDFYDAADHMESHGIREGRRVPGESQEVERLRVRTLL